MQGYKAKASFESVEVDGVLMDLELEYSIGDVGIGSYEFWGFKGCDSRMGLEEVNVLSAKYSEGQEGLPQMSAERYLEIHDDLLSDLAENHWKTTDYEPDYEED